MQKNEDRLKPRKKMKKSFSFYQRCDLCNRPVKNPVTRYVNGSEIEGVFHIGCINKYLISQKEEDIETSRVK